MKRYTVMLILGVLLTLAAQTSMAQGEACGTNAVWAGSISYGMSCLDDSGWHTQVQGQSSIPANSFSDVAVCPSGTIYALHVFGISVFDGTTWQDAPKGDWFAPRGIACGENDELWVAHMNGVHHYSGGEWESYAMDQFGTSPFIIGVEDVVTGANGSVWALTSHSASRFVDGTWQVFEEGSGFNDDFNLSEMVITDSGIPYLLHFGGMLKYNDGIWETVGMDLVAGSTMAVDGENRLWVGSVTEGVGMYDGASWTIYNRDNSDLPTNQIRAVAADNLGRVWAGTDWGLYMFDDESWTPFTMANSDLLDNRVNLVLALGDGPATLPTPQEKGTGSVIGVIEDGREAVANIQVELCTESMGGLFYGSTPCEGQPDRQLTTTNDAGEFVFENVPVGRYEITIDTPDGWIYFVGIGTTIEVNEGMTTDLDDLDISQ